MVARWRPDKALIGRGAVIPALYGTVFDQPLRVDFLGAFFEPRLLPFLGAAVSGGAGNTIVDSLGTGGARSRPSGPSDELRISGASGAARSRYAKPSRSLTLLTTSRGGISSISAPFLKSPRALCTSARLNRLP